MYILFRCMHPPGWESEDLLAPDHIVSALQARGSPGRRSQQGSLVLDDKLADSGACCLAL